MLMHEDTAARDGFEPGSDEIEGLDEAEFRWRRGTAIVETRMAEDLEQIEAEEAPVAEPETAKAA